MVKASSQFRVPSFVCFRDDRSDGYGGTAMLIRNHTPFPPIVVKVEGATFLSLYIASPSPLILNPTSCADALSQAMLSVTDDIFPLKKHSVVDILSPPWWDQECTQAVEEEELKFYTVETCPRKTLSTFLRHVPSPGASSQEEIRKMAQIISLDTPFSLYESNLVLSSLTDSAPDIDGISYSFLINASEQVLSYYLDIDNSVVITDNVPITWKTQTIIPIFKNKENPEDIAVFRPITLCSIFAKIAEYLVKNQLAWIGESRSLLANSQYGFRKAACLDVSSAYDNVLLPILRDKLHKLKMPVRLSNFIFDLLSERKILLRIGETDHCNYVVTKVEKNISILGWLSGTWWGDHPYFLKLLYNAIVRSHLDYESFLLEPIKTIALKRSNLVQARVRRIIVNCMKSSAISVWHI
ncbi:Probable RNA-directed DNA polymerase from transposon X-element [Eumeta japonica]|uniref:Probable RNA-directed DNA polymerase from transposon X-element n=1 Tax=Eumeta variegata TaxID=151549 RepID=A0A4C1XJF9_EUMVA|nr:Probable RNA-directed DNA polymerase from transposon X-element [Eumeta japonica]